MKKIAEYLVRGIQGVNRFMYWLTELNVFLITLIVFVSVFWRYVLNSPLEWSDEITTYMFVFVVFLGAADVERQNAHIRLEFLIERLDQGKRRIVEMIILCISLFWCSIICWSSWKAVVMAYKMDFASSSILRFPLFISYSFLFIGLLILSLQLLIMLIKHLGMAALSNTEVVRQ